MRNRSRAYTLTETVVVVGLLLLAALAAAIGARTWQDSQRTDRTNATLGVVAEAEQLEHRRFGSFTTDPARMAQLVDEVSVVATSTDTDEVVLAEGTYTDVTHGTVDAVVVAVADGPTCRVLRVPDTDVPTDPLEEEFTGSCGAAGALDAVGVTP